MTPFEFVAASVLALAAGAVAGRVARKGGIGQPAQTQVSASRDVVVDGQRVGRGFTFQGEADSPVLAYLLAVLDRPTEAGAVRRIGFSDSPTEDAE